MRQGRNVNGGGERGDTRATKSEKCRVMLPTIRIRRRDARQVTNGWTGHAAALNMITPCLL